MRFKDLQYEKPYLTNGICRIDFSPIEQSVIEEISVKFADTIKLLKRILEETNFKHEEIYYYAWY